MECGSKVITNNVQEGGKKWGKKVNKKSEQKKHKKKYSQKKRASSHLWGADWGGLKPQYMYVSMVSEYKPREVNLAWKRECKNKEGEKRRIKSLRLELCCKMVR